MQSGHGVDHLVVLVRDLQKSKTDYLDLLGFEMSPLGRHPQGTENSVARFQDDTYLELLSAYDSAKAKDVAASLEKFEGAVSVGLNVESADGTSSFLRSRGVDNETGTGTIKLEESDDGPVALWKYVGLKPGMPISDAVFFIEYLPERAAFRRRHPEHYKAPDHLNTAKGLTSIWVATGDRVKGVEPYRSLGLEGERRTSIPFLDAEGSEFKAGRGTILVVGPAKPEGKLAKFVELRGEHGIIGASIEVNNLNAARQLFKSNGVDYLDYNGLHGHSLLVPPERTHGYWLELYQG